MIPTFSPSRHRFLAGAAIATALAASLGAQTLLHQEGFNDDGSKANPPRYAIFDGGHYEPPFPSDLSVGGIPDTQLGPVYWAHNFEVSFVGVPGPTKGRRALLAWDGAIADADVKPDGWKLVEGAIKWLAKNKANATVLFTPNAAAAQSMADHLAAAGYTVADDDETLAETAVTADVVVRAPGGANVSRFAQSPRGVMVFSASDHDDMLTGSIGSTATFEAGLGTIATAHAAANGLTGSFSVATGEHNWNLMGDILPTGAITVANFVRSVPPTAASLADVDAMAAGTKPSTRATDTFAAVDFSDSSAGSFGVDSPIPGGASGVFGLVVKGKLNVSVKGKYSFALNEDDGARLRIDKDKNGFSATDDVIKNDAAGDVVQRADVTFDAIGVYDFEIVLFNSGGPGKLEFAVSTQANGGDTSALDSGSWELLGQTTSAGVSLQGSVSATSHVPTGDPVLLTLPLLVVNNGPTDSPPGNVFGGGPFTGFEGTGFFAGSAMNKFNVPPISQTDDFGEYRAVRLVPVDVTGKTSVKVTVALAATFLDFETNDRLVIVAYPDGIGSTPVRLARFTAPTGAVKYFADVDHQNSHRLGLAFQDATYDAPAGSRQLVIEIRSRTTWWNETVAFDNIRITSGAVTVPLGNTTATVNGDSVKLSWTGGTGPYLVQGKLALGDASWIDLQTVTGTSASIPLAAPGAFFRVKDGATKTVKLFKAVLNGANERPTPVTEVGTGLGLLALDGLTVTYFVGYDRLTGAPTGQHLHGLGTAEQAAGVKFGLMPSGTPGTSGFFTGQNVVDQATADGIVAGLTYFNIHTAKHGGGEIRGQVLAVP